MKGVILLEDSLDLYMYLEDLDGSLKIVKIPNLQKFRSLFKTSYGKLNIDDFKWVDDDIINLFIINFKYIYNENDYLQS